MPEDTWTKLINENNRFNYLIDGIIKYLHAQGSTFAEAKKVVDYVSAWIDSKHEDREFEFEWERHESSGKWCDPARRAAYMETIDKEVLPERSKPFVRNGCLYIDTVIG